MARSRFLPLLAIVLLLGVGLLLSCGSPPVAVEPHADPFDAMMYAHSALTYKIDDIDNWQTPTESLRKGTGDCEDFALLMLESLRLTGIRGEFVIVHIAGSSANHAIVYVDGIYYDPTGADYGPVFPATWRLIVRYSYSIALMEARWDEIELFLRYGRVDKTARR